MQVLVNVKPSYNIDVAHSFGALRLTPAESSSATASAFCRTKEHYAASNNRWIACCILRLEPSRASFLGFSLFSAVQPPTPAPPCGPPPPSRVGLLHPLPPPRLSPLLATTAPAVASSSALPLPSLAHEQGVPAIHPPRPHRGRCGRPSELPSSPLARSGGGGAS